MCGHSMHSGKTLALLETPNFRKGQSFAFSSGTWSSFSIAHLISEGLFQHFEKKLISLTFSMLYLVLGGSPSKSPRTLAEEERLRKHCAKVWLSKHFSVHFLEATPGCGLKRSQPVLLTVFPHMAMFGHFCWWGTRYFEAVVGFPQWQNYNNISCL